MTENPYLSPTADADASGPWPPARARWALVIVGILLVPVLWLALAFADPAERRWWAPGSLILLPVLMILDPLVNSLKLQLFLCGAAFLGLFATLSFPLASGRPRIPRRPLVFVLQMLNLIYLVLALFRCIIRREDLVYAFTVSGISLGLCGVVIWLAVHCAARPGFMTALAFQGLAWFWLILYSFPLLFSIVLSV